MCCFPDFEFEIRIASLFIPPICLAYGKTLGLLLQAAKLLG
jgi:hypothetical protein